MIVNETNERIETLERLNAFLADMQERSLLDAGSHTLPLDAAAVGASDAAAVDAAIRDSAYTMSNGWVELDDLVTNLTSAVSSGASSTQEEDPGPSGYEAHENPPFWAYINFNGYSLDDQAIKLLVRAAHNDGNSRHQTSESRGTPSDASAYIHLYGGRNEIYAFRDDGYHGEYPKVTVVGAGDVSDGVHRWKS